MQQYDSYKDSDAESGQNQPPLLFRNKYRIPSARKADHDYSGGAYFVTICCEDRECFFGHIVEAGDGEKKMILNDIGRCTEQVLTCLPLHSPYAAVPLWVVMPNHVHLIVIIDGEKTPYECRGNAEMGPNVETRHATSLSEPKPEPTNGKNAFMQEIANMQGWLSVAVGGFKSAVTKYAGENNIEFGWQTRFHDHIIRNQEEMNRIAEYIENNVAKWKEDCFYVESTKTDVVCRDAVCRDAVCRDAVCRDAACHVSTDIPKGKRQMKKEGLSAKNGK